MQIDCGKSGAWNGWPKPRTASTPKMTGMCSHDLLIANCCMVLYSLAHSRPVLPVPPEGVVAGGNSVPPARIDPVWLPIRSSARRQGWAG